jgi:hypothetical protein
LAPPEPRSPSWLGSPLPLPWQLAAPLDLALPDRHHRAEVAGELRVRGDVVVGGEVREVVEDARVAVREVEAAAEQR